MLLKLYHKALWALLLPHQTCWLGLSYVSVYTYVYIPGIYVHGSEKLARCAAEPCQVWFEDCTTYKLNNHCSHGPLNGPCGETLETSKILA